MEDRRRVTRRSQDFDVTCYIDGAKLEAHVLDISKGGVFVSTDTSRPVPVGALAGIVFVPDKVKIATTFMFGRVVRKQDVPVRGFAVRWEKAVSAGRPDDLALFLKTLVDLVDVVVEQEVVGTSSSGGPISRCVYRFPETAAFSGAPVGDDLPDLGKLPDPVSAEKNVTPAGDVALPEDEDVMPREMIAFEEAPEETEKKPPAAARHSGRRHLAAPAVSMPVVGPTTDIFSCLRTLDVSDEEVSAVRITTGPTRHKPRHHVADRPSPLQISPAGHAPAVQTPFRGIDDIVIPCRLDGSIFVIDSSVPVVVTALGQSSAVIRSRFVPVDESQPLTLVLIIGTRKGDVPLRCHGRVTVIERGPESGFRMSFSSVEEGDSAGVLERYLKWLEFNAASPT